MDKKKLAKSIESFERLKAEHLEKIKNEKKNYAVVEYWEKQIRRFEEEIKKRKKMLEKL